MPDAVQQILEAINKMSERLRRLEIRPWGGSGGVGPGSAGHIIQDEAVSLTQRPYLNFTGAGVTATDNVGNNTTDVTIPGSTGGHIIQDESVDLPAEARLNFIGPNVIASDNPGTGATDVTISGGGLSNRVLLFKDGDEVVQDFDADDTGLDAAFAAANAGDFVIHPIGTISGDHTVPSNVHLAGWSRYESILTGTITLSAGSSLSNLTVDVDDSIGTTLSGVIGPSSGIAIVFESAVSSNNAGAGDAIGVNGLLGGTVIVDHCDVEGISSGGSGYGCKETPTASGTVTALSYNEPITVYATRGDVQRATVPITAPGGDCSAENTSCLIHGVQGGGPAYVVYDLGRMWTLDGLHTQWAAEGHVQIWNSPYVPDPAGWPDNWPGEIWWEERSWPDFYCFHFERPVPHEIYQGTKQARYLMFLNEYYVLLGDHEWLAWFELIGHYNSYGTMELYYNRISGSTYSISGDPDFPNTKVYGNEYPIDSTEGMIEYLNGDRSTWNDIDYPDQHARDIFEDTPIHHTPEPGTAGNVIVDDGDKWVSQAPGGTDTTAIHDNVSAEIQPIPAENSIDPTDVLIFEKASDGYSKRSIQSQFLTVGGSGHVIEDNGTPMTARANLDLIGFLVADNVGNNATEVSMLTESIEDLSAQIPAVGNHYDLSFAVQASSLKVYKNGLRQQSSSFTIDVDGLGFTTDFDCEAGDKLVVDYNQASMPIKQEVVTFSYADIVEASAPTFRIYNTTNRNRIISKVFLSVNIASSSGAVLCNVYVDGVSVFTLVGHKPSIAVGANTGSTILIDLPAWDVDSYLQASVETPGLGTNDLVIHVVYS